MVAPLYTSAVVMANPPTINTPVQVRIVATGTPVQFPAGDYLNGLVIKARATNAGDVVVGRAGVVVAVDGAGNGYPISKGEAISYALSQSSDLWLNGTAGDIVYVTGN